MEKPILSALLCIISVCPANAQQPLPYQQDFSELSNQHLIYPAGWQGLAFSHGINDTTLTQLALRAGTANSTSGGIYYYGSGIGWLNTNTNDYAITLAINSSKTENIILQYDIKTIRNPYDNLKNTRINEAIVQYKVNETNQFINLNNSKYLSDTLSAFKTIKVTLPYACNNKALIQLRWLSKDLSGTGNRPAFEIDNIFIYSAGKDSTAPDLIKISPFQTSVYPVSILQAEFDEPLQVGDGNIYITDLTNQKTDTLNIKDKSITISDQTIIIKRILSSKHQYQITTDSGIVKDFYGNSFNGIGKETNWNFNTDLTDYLFSFDDCGGNNYSSFSVKGPQHWVCKGNIIQMNGFENKPIENEDWLISPELDISNFNYPVLSYTAKKEFEGPDLELNISGTYKDGDPRMADWKGVYSRWPVNADSGFMKIKDINLAAFKNSKIRIAFVYNSDKIQQAARWSVAEISVKDVVAEPLPCLTLDRNEIDFGAVKTGNPSTEIVHCYVENLLTNIELQAPEGFELSIDGEHFTNRIKWSVGANTLYIRFVPREVNKSWSGELIFRYKDLKLGALRLKGNTYRSLKVVNWNIEWFGSPSAKPDNDSLQQANVFTILKKLDADIYGLAEIVDTNRLREVVQQLPGYKYVISSYADSLSGPLQKLAFVYKTGVCRFIGARNLLRYNSSDKAFYNWASGRFPFLMQVEVHEQKDTMLLNLVLVHAKANTGDQVAAWQRRKDGVRELKDTLDRYFATANVLLLGDFNDDLTKSIANGNMVTGSSWKDFLEDEKYLALTLPLSMKAEQSTIAFPSMIDHVIATNGLMVADRGVAKVGKEVKDWIFAYGTTTSDHYPIITYYNWEIMGNPYPVRDLTAQAEDDHIIIRWDMPYQINCENITVERQRDRFYESVAVLPGTINGSTKQENHYWVRDLEAHSGINYYRLKIRGTNNELRYTSPIFVFKPDKDRTLKSIWRIFGGQLQYWIDWTQRERVSIQLIDLHGRISYQEITNLEQGYNYKTIVIDQLPTGIYFLRVKSGGQDLVMRILVNH
ncbi:T9SS C-terminal target domain-containing protein [Chitinophaga silvatica]|uniref:T9SS C-terminal target domain-containing protein n=1 Tax=Chitinophaga silvatica TaxID=2282649 RepID=A0A3E1YDC8_9BACT|nr:endonuclease/exonuclease/phosphatase family protein [Chitinophaga silvatica]RFS24531.1 T9SS C-terminal target domain-containing protein [Chitinophaga silvatica]